MINLNFIKKLILLCIYITFVFSNSLTPATLSTNNSDYVASIAGNFLSMMKISITFSILTFIIRKAAHLTEYFFLGVLFQTTFSEFSKKKKIYIISLLTILIPICDELLQKITPGRSCEIRDMLLDATGIMIGLLTYHLLSQLKKKKKQTRNQTK